MALYGSGRTTGLVVDVGEHMSVAPVYEGHVVQHYALRQSLGGCDLTEYMVKVADISSLFSSYLYSR